MKGRWIITVWAEGEHAAEHRFEGDREEAIKDARERARAFEAKSGRASTWEVAQAYRVLDSDANVVMCEAGYWTLADAVAAAQALALHVWGPKDVENTDAYETAQVCASGTCYAFVQAREVNGILDEAGFPYMRNAASPPRLIAEVTFTELGRDTLTYEAEGDE